MLVRSFLRHTSPGIGPLDLYTTGVKGVVGGGGGVIQGTCRVQVNACRVESVPFFFLLQSAGFVFFQPGVHGMAATWSGSVAAQLRELGERQLYANSGD